MSKRSGFPKGFRRRLEFAHLVHAFHRIGIQAVSANRRVGFQPGDGLFEAMYSDGIRARNDEEIRVAPRLYHRAQLLHHFVLRDQLLASEVPAFLGERLVFQMQAGSTRLLPQPHGSLHIQHAAIAGIRIGENGQIRGATNSPDVLEHLGLRKKADVRGAKDDAGRDEAAHEDGRRARCLGELGGDRIMGTHADERLAIGKERAKALVTGHGHLLGRNKIASQSGLSVAGRMPVTDGINPPGCLPALTTCPQRASSAFVCSANCCGFM